MRAAAGGGAESGDQPHGGQVTGVWGEDSVDLLMSSLGGLQFPVSRRIHSSLGCDNIKMLISIEELRRNPFQVSLYFFVISKQLFNTSQISKYLLSSGT